LTSLKPIVKREASSKTIDPLPKEKGIKRMGSPNKILILGVD
jgi:hypothetical protein